MSHTTFNPARRARESFRPPPTIAPSATASSRAKCRTKTRASSAALPDTPACFSTAGDLAVFAHAMLNGGYPILRPETVELFTRRESAPEGTSRALGWDTPSAPSQSGKIFFAALVRAPWLHRNFAVDRSGAPTFNHVAHQPHLARLPEPGHQAGAAGVSRCGGRSPGGGSETLEAQSSERQSETEQQTSAASEPRKQLGLRRSRQQSSLEIARIINREDAKVAAAVKRALPQIAQVIDWIAAALAQGRTPDLRRHRHQRTHRRARRRRMSANV